MNRAMRRRMAREEARNREKVYELTESQIRDIKADAVKKIEEQLVTSTVKRAVAVSRSLMVAVTMNVLGHCYWEKSAK